LHQRFLHILLCLPFWLFSHTASGQAQNEYGVWAGAAQYLGDMNPHFNVRGTRHGMGVFFRYNFSDRMAVRAGINYGMIHGDDKYAKNQPYLLARNLDFTSQIMEFETVYEINFFKYIPGQTDKHKFTPYLFAGGGIIYYNPYTTYNDNKYKLQLVGTEGQKDDEYEGKRYSTYTFAIPFGGGFKFNLNHKFSLNIFASSRRTFSDFLDDISGVYPDKSEVNYFIEGENIGHVLYDKSADGIGLPGKQRGTNKAVDRFNFYGIAVTYTIFQSKCPKF
jgi:hypothetical protein